MMYRVGGGKIVCSTVRSSSKVLIALKGDLWLEKEESEFRLGLGDKIVFVFPLSKLLKLLDS
jgi:hypothetical protein